MVTKKKTKKTKKHIARVLTAVFALALILFSALPIGAISGNFYVGNGSFSSGYDTTRDVIRPICDNNLVFISDNGYMNNYYASNIIINNDSLICNDFKVTNGAISYDRIWPWTDEVSLAYPSANNLPTFNYSRGGNNTQVVYTLTTADLAINGVETSGQSDYALLKLFRQDDCYYEFGSPRGTDSSGNPTYNFYYPRYMSVYSKDFFMTLEAIEDFVFHAGYFGYRINQIGDDDVWLNPTYHFTIEYIDIETGEEHTYSSSSSASSFRSTSGNYMHLPLIPKIEYDILASEDSNFGKARLVYVKNIYCNYDMEYSWYLENATDNGTHIYSYLGYIMCNNKNIDGTDFTGSQEDTTSWNVAFDKEFLPESFASRQRYLTSFAHRSDDTYTGFIGNALRGVLEPDIFGTFGIGDIMGIIIAFAVVMGFLKFFCGG